MQGHFFYADFLRALKMPKAWVALTKRNLKATYRRSFLGIIWISITVGITIAALSAVYTFLFPISLAEYMPYLAVSYISWIAISNILLSAPNIFIQYASFIQEEKAPFSNYIFAAVSDKLVILFNHSLIIIIVMVIFNVPIGLSWFIIPYSILIYFITGIGLGFLLGLMAAYYRDVNQVLVSIVQLSFFITPVLWKPEFLTGKTFIVDYNPFYHYLVIIRQPLLDQSVPWISLGITSFIAIVSIVGGIMAMNKYRNQLIYWV